MPPSFAVGLVRSAYPHLSDAAIAARLRYASFVSLDTRILYIETPKAACTALKGFMRALAGAPPLAVPGETGRETRRDMVVHLRSNVPLPSLVDLDDKTQHDVLTAPDFLRFAVVRNPYARLISAWRNKVMLCEPGYEHVHERVMGSPPPTEAKTLLTFEQFVDFIENEGDFRTCDPHWRRQVDLLFPSAISYTHTGKIERLRETIDVLSDHLGRSEPIHIGRSNTTSTGSVAITEKLATRIYRAYEADFQTFGYDAGSWRALNDGGAEQKLIPQDRFHDEIVERNLVIAQLYKQRESLKSQYRKAYRFSLVRLRDKLLGRARTL